MATDTTATRGAQLTRPGRHLAIIFKKLPTGRNAATTPSSSNDTCWHGPAGTGKLERYGASWREAECYHCGGGEKLGLPALQGSTAAAYDKATITLSIEILRARQIIAPIAMRPNPERCFVSSVEKIPE